MSDSLDVRVEAIPRDYLVAALHARGICYLAPTPHGDEPPLSDDEVLLSLAASKDGRLRFALVALLLRQRNLAERAAQLVAVLAADPNHARTARELQRQYVATMYLQRMWRTRLAVCAGINGALIPERYTRELSLPPADDMFGERGLRELCERSPYNDWSSYEQVIEALCEQPCPPAGGPRVN